MQLPIPCSGERQLLPGGFCASSEQFLHFAACGARKLLFVEIFRGSRGRCVIYRSATCAEVVLRARGGHPRLNLRRNRSVPFLVQTEKAFQRQQGASQLSLAQSSKRKGKARYWRVGCRLLVHLQRLCSFPVVCRGFILNFCLNTLLSGGWPWFRHSSFG